jgi:hypothetical protein
MLPLLCTSWHWNAMNRPLTTHRVDCIDSLMATSCCMFSKFVIVSSVCLISSIRARLITGVMHSCEPFQVENPSSIHEGITTERKRACSRRSWWGTTFSFFKKGEKTSLLWFGLLEGERDGRNDIMKCVLHYRTWSTSLHHSYVTKLILMAGATLR